MIVMMMTTLVTVKMAMKTVAMIVMIDINGNEFLLSVRTKDAERDLCLCSVVAITAPPHPTPIAVWGRRLADEFNI
jgi:hypothetical protein